MAKDPDPDASVSVTTDEVRVGKTFEADRFPVPAIAFDIESVADEPVRIRLVDDIPESFAMEGVGFHPDYEGDNWTAYRDNRVAYERTFDPGEEVLTVYGIRIDDSEEAAAFLDEPMVELIELGEAAATGDVLGRETTQVVRDALSGEEEKGDLSELGDGANLRLDDEDAPPPRTLGDESETVLDARDESVTAVGAADGDAPDEAGGDTDENATEEVSEDDDGDTTDEASEDDDGDTTDEASEDTDVDASDEADADDDAPDDTVPAAAAAEALDPRDWDDRNAESVMTVADDGDEDEADAPTAATPGSVAAALAAELRAGTVDGDDLAVIEEAFEGEVPTSVDVRVSRLQSQTEDLLAYRDALADFLDENGTAEEVLGNVSADLAALTTRVDDLESSLAAADDERAAVEANVAAVSESVDGMAETVDDVADRVESLEADLAEVQTTAERLDERLDAVEGLDEEIEAIHEELAELQTFRDRLSSAFGPDE